MRLRGVSALTECFPNHDGRYDDVSPAAKAEARLV